MSNKPRLFTSRYRFKGMYKTTSFNCFIPEFSSNQTSDQTSDWKVYHFDKMENLAKFLATVIFNKQLSWKSSKSNPSDLFHMIEIDLFGESNIHFPVTTRIDQFYSLRLSKIISLEEVLYVKKSTEDEPNLTCHYKKTGKMYDSMPSNEDRYHLEGLILRELHILYLQYKQYYDSPCLSLFKRRHRSLHDMFETHKADSSGSNESPIENQVNPLEKTMSSCPNKIDSHKDANNPSNDTQAEKIKQEDLNPSPKPDPLYEPEIKDRKLLIPVFKNENITYIIDNSSNMTTSFRVENGKKIPLTLLEIGLNIKDCNLRRVEMDTADAIKIMESQREYLISKL